MFTHTNLAITFSAPLDFAEFRKTQLCKFKSATTSFVTILIALYGDFGKLWGIADNLCGAWAPFILLSVLRA